MFTTPCVRIKLECAKSLGLRILQLTSFIRSMMKVIEGHFNPLKRPARTIYSFRLTEKVQLDSDERGEKRGNIE